MGGVSDATKRAAGIVAKEAARLGAKNIDDTVNTLTSRALTYNDKRAADLLGQLGERLPKTVESLGRAVPAPGKAPVPALIERHEAPIKALKAGLDDVNQAMSPGAAAKHGTPREIADAVHNSIEKAIKGVDDALEKSGTGGRGVGRTDGPTEFRGMDFKVGIK